MDQHLTRKPEVNFLGDLADSVLCIIDFQSKLAESMPRKAVERMMQNVKVLLHASEILKIPVIASEQSTQILGGLVNEIIDYLPEETFYIEKTSFSCCGELEFVDFLNKSNCHQVILVGLEAHISVMQTALDLNESGFDVFVVEDTVGSRRLDNYRNALNRLSHAGICITNSESVIAEWLRDSDQDKFKLLACI